MNEDNQSREYELTETRWLQILFLLIIIDLRFPKVERRVVLLAFLESKKAFIGEMFESE